MATPAEELITAVNTDDATRVAELVATDPALASSRDLGGVSAIMLSRYRFNRETTDALLAADPELDVFEATALGYIDRLRDRLMSDPGSVSAFSPDGFTALHYAGFFGKLEAARELIAAGAAVDVYTTNDFANQPLHAAAAGRHLEVCRAAARGGRGRERHPARRVYAVARVGPERRCRAERALPVGGCRSRRCGAMRARRRRRSPRPPVTTTWRHGSARSPRRADVRSASAPGQPRSR